MSHSQAQSRHPDASRRYMHDAKDESQVACTDIGTAHNPHASHRHTRDLESELSDEEAAVHAAPDAHSAAHIVLSCDETILTSPDRTGLHVRFRSRVRISAGVGRQRRHSDGLSSNASSISSSPSSSISAPLRTHYTGNNAWGPLGSRVKFAAPQATPLPQRQDEDASGGKRARRRRARPSWMYLDGDVDERTQLLSYATRHSYVGSRYVHDWYYHDAERERQWREQLVDQAFGKWPARLLNRHWWWWHLEPILCCLCGPDEE